jgi:hypothetical protein
MTKENGGTDVWNTTGVYWSQFLKQNPEVTSVNDVALFDLIEIPRDVYHVAGQEYLLNVQDDGSFGGKKWIGTFSCDRSLAGDLGLWLTRVVSFDGTMMKI